MKTSAAIWRGTAIGLALVVGSIIGVATIAADSSSEHGGSADNTPTCIDYTGEEVPAVIVVQLTPTQVPAQEVNDVVWTVLYEFDSDTLCIETTEMVGIRASNSVEIDSEVVGAEGNEQVDTTNCKHCISYQVVIEVTHSLEAIITRE